MNGVGSFLYETDKHGSPIMGNILIVGEVWTGDGIDFCGMSEQQFNILYPEIRGINKESEGNVMKVLHTADWHIGQV